MQASIHFIGEMGKDGMKRFSPDEGARRLAARPPRNDLAPHLALPDHTRLWAALVQASGGVWGGCVYDTDAILDQLSRGSREDEDSGRHENRSSHSGHSQPEEKPA